MTVFGILPAFLLPPLAAQSSSGAIVGWYNGDRASPPIPGYSNWYLSDTQLARVYDDFVVPLGGWTVTGAFSNNSLYGAPAVTAATWEIRAGMSAGNPGTLIASGAGPATQTYSSNTNDYRIEVNGLQVQLPAGRYWLSVTPVGPGPQQSYLDATLGARAIGNPAGNNGGAFFYSNHYANSFFIALQSTGQGGSSGDFSQGVLISNQPPPAISAADQWRADIAYLAQQMPLLHSVPFPGIDQADFQANAADLWQRAGALSDAEIRTGIQALVASIEDPHTDVAWPNPRPFQSLPLSFYWFDDGIYVIGAPAQYQDLLGGKVLFIGQTSIDEAAQRMASLVPHENDSWAKFQIPLNKLNNTDFLFGTGIVPDSRGAVVSVEKGPGDVASSDVQAFRQDQFPRLLPVFQGDLPLYRQHPDRNYWATVIDDGATVYFQYNSCTEDAKQPSADFFSQLNALLTQDVAQRLVVDLRNNSGGFTTILDPWIDQIKDSPFNRAGRLYVIIGRATFSAAMAASDRFHDETAAIFVGEPTGGKPRFQLRRGDFALPYFGIRVSYSRGVMDANDYDPALVPDIPTGLTFRDYMNGADPAMDAILLIPPPGR